MLALRTRSLGLCLAAAALIALSASASARADTVTDWNVNAVNALVTKAGQSPTVSTVHLAMVHGAVYDAVNSIDERYEPYLVEVRARDWYSKDAAAATAAYRVLLGIVRGSGADPDAALQRLARVDPGRRGEGRRHPRGRGRRGGHAGRPQERRPLRRVPLPGSRDADRAVAGRPVAAGAAGLRQRPRGLDQGRPAVPDRRRRRYPSPAPYALTSKKYAREFDEVKSIGSLNSTTRTADQTDQARFWAEGPQIWTRVARQLVGRPRPAQHRERAHVRDALHDGRGRPDQRVERQGGSTCSGARSPRSARPTGTTTRRPRRTPGGCR